MEDLIASIRDALQSDASPDARAAGAAACRAALAALGSMREAPLDPPATDQAADPAAIPAAPDPIAGARSLIDKLARVPAGHRLDLAIDVALGKLRGILPTDAPPIEIRVPRFPLVPLGARTGGVK